MKINSQQTGRGKLGNTVYALSGGACIVRQKAESVSNPNTEAQVETRSNFKLLSQLAAAMSPVIAIKKQGLVSGRNQFMTINKDSARYSDGVASINLNKVQITKSARGLEDFMASRSSGTRFAVGMLADVSGIVDRMVYSMFKKNMDGSLVLIDSKVVSEAGVDGTFPADLLYTASSVVIFAYGIKLTNAASQTAFGNMVAPSAEQVAKLLTTSSEAASGSQVTRTKACTINEGEETGASDQEEHYMVSVTASGNGSVSGGGSYVAGQMATLVATPDAEASFVAWKRGNASGAVLSTNPSYSFEVIEDIIIVGVFQGGPTPHYTISASVDPVGAGSVSGAGSIEEGATCTLVATPAEGKRFLNWTENGSVVSTNANYAFTVQNARTLVAHFGDIPVSGFSNMQFNNQAWNSNKDNQDARSYPISGTFTSEDTYTKVGFVTGDLSASAPAIGAQVNVTNLLTDNQGALSGNLSVGNDTSYYLVATNVVGGHDVVVAVYQYRIAGESSM